MEVPSSHSPDSAPLRLPRPRHRFPLERPSDSLARQAINSSRPLQTIRSESQNPKLTPRHSPRLASSGTLPQRIPHERPERCHDLAPRRNAFTACRIETNEGRWVETDRERWIRYALSLDTMAESSALEGVGDERRIRRERKWRRRSHMVHRLRTSSLVRLASLPFFPLAPD